MGHFSPLIAAAATAKSYSAAISTDFNTWDYFLGDTVSGSPSTRLYENNDHGVSNDHFAPRATPEIHLGIGLTIVVDTMTNAAFPLATIMVGQ
jgi:hypothetical protein